MTPLEYFTRHIWIHKQGKNVRYEDKRTDQIFHSREKVNEHCREMAENFESQATLGEVE